MPKIQDPTPNRPDRSTQNINAGIVSDRTRILPHNPPEPVHRDQPAIYIQNTDTDLKIKILSANIAENYLPIDFSKNQSITEKELVDLADTAYIYIDNNGNPVKILASTVLRTEIKWDDLAQAVQDKILQLINQSKLKAGDNITIDNNNVISAQIGVKSINGRTDDVILTAGDLNVYTKDATYSKIEVYNKTELGQMFNDMIVDGGRVGE